MALSYHTKGPHKVITQKALADRIFLSPQTICDCLKGKTNLSEEKRVSIAKTLGFKRLDDFIEFGAKLKSDLGDKTENMPQQNTPFATPPPTESEQQQILELVKRAARILSSDAYGY